MDGDGRGTPAYMAPEQSSALPGAVTVRSDVYGLGAILWELLTGKPPAQQRHVDELLRLRADISSDLAAIVVQCLEEAPERRYASALALAADLRRYLAREFVEARNPGQLERWARKARRHPVAWSLVAALVATAVTGVASVVIQWRRAEAHLTTSQQETIRANANLSDAEAAIVALSQAVEDGNFAATILGLPASESNDALTRLHDHALRQARMNEQSLEFLATTACRQASGHSLQGDDVAAEAGYRQAFDVWRRALLAEAPWIEINRSAVHCAYVYELHQRKLNGGKTPTNYIDGTRVMSMLNAEDELDAAWLTAYAAMLEKRSGILRQYERFTEAEWHADSAASIFRVLRNIRAVNVELLVGEARALHQRALAQSRQLEYERAVASWQMAMKLIEGTHGESPTNPEVARWLAKIQAGYVRHVWNRGNLRQVRKEADEARAILEALLTSKSPDDAAAAPSEEVLDLADMQFACGDLCETERRLNEATAFWRPALEHFTAYYLHHAPQPAERLRCARLAFQLAQASRSLGKLGDAEANYLLAVEWVRPILVRRAPREDVVKLMAACYDARGDIAWRDGRMVEAGGAFDSSFEVLQINASARRFDNDARRAERQAQQARRDRVGGN
ncbi:MAG: hypothetical protein SGJ19_13665 [Planctomycetia bacterium]|nr:hypothetical protein [Planctomycetia bacterium]